MKLCEEESTESVDILLKEKKVFNKNLIEYKRV